jgi:hypothetical protein
MDPVSFAQSCNNTTMYSVFVLDYTRGLAENPGKFLGVIRPRSPQRGKDVRYMPGWTVQCINPKCGARGLWLRVDAAPKDECSNCGAPLHSVPPPLGPRFRMRPRSLGSYRPPARPR